MGNFRDTIAVAILYESRDGVACNKNRYDVITIGNFHDAIAVGILYESRDMSRMTINRHNQKQPFP